MRTTNLSLIGTVIVALLFHPGCSFLFVKGPPAEHAQMSSFDCSESMAWPMIDATWAALAALNGIGVITAILDTTTKTPDQTRVIVVGASWLLLSGISAIDGFGKVRECNAARRQWAERYSRGNVPASPVSPRPGPVAAPVEAAPAPAAPETAPAVPPPTPDGASSPGAAPRGAPPSPGTSLLAPTAPKLPGRSARPRSLAMRPGGATD